MAINSRGTLGLNSKSHDLIPPTDLDKSLRSFRLLSLDSDSFIVSGDNGRLYTLRLNGEEPVLKQFSDSGAHTMPVLQLLRTKSGFVAFGYDRAMSVWEVISHGQELLCDMITLTHMPGASIAPNELAFTQPGELMILQHSSGCLQKLLYWTIKDRQMAVSDCSTQKILNRTIVEVLGIFACSEVYMLIAIGLKHAEHTQIVVYHALTKEIVWKLKVKEEVQQFTLLAVSCSSDEKLEVSAQTRKLIGAYKFKILLLTTHGNEVQLSEHDRAEKSKVHFNHGFDESYKSQMKSVTAKSANYSGLVVTSDDKVIGKHHNLISHSYLLL